MLKKITIGLTVLLSSYSAASLAQSRTPVDVNVPCYNGGVTFGLAGLYLQPSSNGLDYAVVYPVDDTIVGNGSVKNVNLHHDWGYRINAGYVFPCTGNDVMVTYTRYNREKNNSFGTAANEIGFSTLSTFLLGDDVPVAAAAAKAAFNYQALDVDFGQHLDVGCRTHLRFLGGVRLARLDQHLDANYTGPLVLTPEESLAETAITNQQSKFKGVGPRFGVEAEYSLGQGFGIVGQATSALLVGQNKASFNEHDVVLSSTGDVTEEEVAGFNSKSDRVVPNVGGKLGINYNYQFCNPSRTKLTVEAGYQVDYFYNVADRLTSTDLIGISTHNATNVSFNGPYIGIQVKV